VRWHSSLSLSLSGSEGDREGREGEMESGKREKRGRNGGERLGQLLSWFFSFLRLSHIVSFSLSLSLSLLSVSSSLIFFLSPFSSLLSHALSPLLELYYVAVVGRL